VTGIVARYGTGVVIGRGGGVDGVTAWSARAFGSLIGDVVDAQAMTPPPNANPIDRETVTGMTEERAVGVPA
jgi:hypothetical protein